MANSACSLNYLRCYYMLENIKEYLDKPMTSLYFDFKLSGKAFRLVQLPGTKNNLCYSPVLKIRPRPNTS